MNPKLSVITDEFHLLDFERVVEYLSSIGIEYVELRQVWVKNIGYFDDVDVGEVKDILKDAGLKISCIAGAIFKCDWWGLPGEEKTMGDGTSIKDSELKLAENCIKLAKEFDAKYVRAFGFKKKSFDDEETAWNTWFSAMENVIKMAQEANKIVCVENENACMVSSSESIKKVFNTIKSDHCKLLFDPGNLFRLGEDITDDILDLAKDLTGYVHVKDAIRERDNPSKMRGVIACEGEVGWGKIVEMLENNGYDSFYSLETHMGGNRWGNSDESLKNLRWLLENYKEYNQSGKEKSFFP
ncbi:MAG: sugar phosphate isomerase/epimerase family protein [Candidatus Hodarchaeota archaeon]